MSPIPASPETVRAWEKLVGLWQDVSDGREGRIAKGDAPFATKLREQRKPGLHLSQHPEPLIGQAATFVGADAFVAPVVLLGINPRHIGKGARSDADYEEGARQLKLAAREPRTFHPLALDRAATVGGGWWRPVLLLLAHHISIISDAQAPSLDRAMRFLETHLVHCDWLAYRSKNGRFLDPDRFADLQSVMAMQDLVKRLQDDGARLVALRPDKKNESEGRSWSFSDRWPGCTVAEGLTEELVRDLARSLVDRAPTRGEKKS